MSRELPELAPPGEPGTLVTVSQRCSPSALVVETDWRSDGQIEDRVVTRASPSEALMTVDEGADGTIEQWIKVRGKQRGVGETIVKDRRLGILLRVVNRRDGAGRIAEQWIYERGADQPARYTRVQSADSGDVQVKQERKLRADGGYDLRTWYFAPGNAMWRSSERRATEPNDRVRCRFQTPCTQGFLACEQRCAAAQPPARD